MTNAEKPNPTCNTSGQRNPFEGMFTGSQKAETPLWQQPIPLLTESRSEPYPLEELPELIRNAVEEVEEFSQAPIPLIAASALAVVSSAVQGLASVERSEGLRGPAALYFLTLARSGERKTTVDRYFSEPMSQWEAEQKELNKPILAEYRARLSEWQCLEDGYKQAIKIAAKNKETDQQAVELLAQLELNRPSEPRVPSILRMDDTPEALGVALMKWPIASIMSNEAGIIFGAHGMNPDSVMRNMASLNICWDGGHLKRDRTTTHSIDIQGMRVTVGLQVQPDTLKVFLSKQGALAKGIGFLARFLVAFPESTQGGRYFKEVRVGQPAVDAFHARVRELLSIPAQVDMEGGLTTGYLALSSAAKTIWVGFHDEVEEQLGFGGDFFDVQEVASKAADNAARLAACFHVFCDHGGETAIAGTTMDKAVELMRWYLRESLRFTEVLAIPESTRKAIHLEEWLAKQLKDGMPLVPTRMLKQYGPNELRHAAGVEAFSVLEDHHRALLITRGQRKFYCLNPELVKEYR